MQQNIKNGTFILGDCLEEMKQIPDGVVDMILCDLPYGTTACKWDTIIPFEPLWEQYNRIIKDNGAIVLTASQPFTSVLVASKLDLYKCAWIWEKTRPSNFFQAKYVPLNNTEDILVFSKGGTNNGSKIPMFYNPQGIKTIDRKAKNSNTGGKIGKEHKTTLNETDYHQTVTGYPLKTIKFNNDLDTFHPTQKPVALFEYLIKTYTNEGDLVLDNCAGSGTTAIAAENTNRKWVCIEQDETYANKAVERILAHVVPTIEQVV